MPFAGLADTELLRAIQAWRRRRRLPRWVLVIDHDRELLVELLNILAIESFLALVKDLANIVLVELFPLPDELCVRGPEGRFIHEVLIPFVRRKNLRSAAGQGGFVPSTPAASATSRQAQSGSMPSS